METFDLFYSSDTSHIHFTGPKQEVVYEIEMKLNDARNWKTRDCKTKKEVRADIFAREHNTRQN